MAGIPPELIFVLVVVGFSVLDGIGRKKKAERGAPGTVPGPRPRPAQDPDTPARGGELVRADSPRPSQQPSTSAPTAADGVIPQDVWAEILGLARGTAPNPERTRMAERVEEPVEESSWSSGAREHMASEEVQLFEGRSMESLEARPEGLHLAPDRSRGPSAPSRKTREQFSATKTPSVLSASGRVVGQTGPEPGKGRGSKVRRALFGTGSTDGLRKAIILQEVLGPPVGLKDDDGIRAQAKAGASRIT